MSDQFREYVTSGAFSLQLSRRQIELLSALDQTDKGYALLSTANALIDKGLCERVRLADGMHFRLTEAGRAVIPLLKIAGLYCQSTPMERAA
jgi:hypothetical protein